jgi:hypothetical protein
MLGLGLAEPSICVMLFTAGLFLSVHLAAVYGEEPGRPGNLHQDHAPSENCKSPKVT